MFILNKKRETKMTESKEIYKYSDNFGDISLYRDNNGFRALNINSGLQFLERDEHRYHQTVFMLPSLFAKPKQQKVLILGGGDGLGARELLKLPTVETIDLVDISSAMIFMSSQHPDMTMLNGNSLTDDRVTVHVQDSNDFIRNAKVENKKWDLIVLDYPDPSIDVNSPINHLFSKEHFAEVIDLLSDDGVMSIQSTSVYISPNVFAKINMNLQQVSTSVFDMVVNMQSFGDIGVIYCRKTKNDNQEWNLQHKVPKRAFFNAQSIARFLYFLEDEKPSLEPQDIENLTISELIKYDISADIKRIENNYYINQSVPSRNRLINISDGEVEKIYSEQKAKKTKQAKDIFVNNKIMLGYPNTKYELLPEDDFFFQSLDIERDENGYINSILKIKEDEEKIESEFIYIADVNSSLSAFKLYDKYLSKKNYEQPLIITYWEHNVLTQKLVDRFGGEIIEEGYTWNIQISETDITKRPKEDFSIELGELGNFEYNGILGCWSTNWVDTKHSTQQIVNLCIENGIPNLSIFSNTPPVEFDYYRYKVAKLDFSDKKANKLLSSLVKRISK